MFSNQRESIQGYLMLNPNTTEEELIRKKIIFEASFEELKLSSVSLSATTLIFTVVGIIINKTYNDTGNIIFILFLFSATGAYFLFSKRMRAIVYTVRDIRTIEYELQKRKEKQAIQKNRMEQIVTKREKRLREKYKI